MSTTQTSFPQNMKLKPWATLVGGLLALVLLTGCPAVKGLREAQDTFNRAATAENAARLGADQVAVNDVVAGTLASASDARLNYQLTLQHLEGLRGDTREWGKLEAAGLSGNALTLQALALWRLGRLDEAYDVAKSVGEETVLLPRDQALLRALPGLILSDQAYARILTETEPCRKTVGGEETDTYCFRGTNGTAATAFMVVSNWIAGPDGALQRLAAASRSVTTNHPVQLYLLQSQLAAYGNLVTAFDRYGPSGSGVDLGTPSARSPDATAQAKRNLTELRTQATRQSGPVAGERLYQYWEGMTGLSVP